MIDLDIKRNHIFDFYLDGSFSERRYFANNLLYMRIVKGNFTSITRVVHGVSVIAIMGWNTEIGSRYLSSIK